MCFIYSKLAEKFPLASSQLCREGGASKTCFLLLLLEVGSAEGATEKRPVFFLFFGFLFFKWAKLVLLAFDGQLTREGLWDCPPTL